MHEYTVFGHPREKIILVIALISLTLSGWFSLLFEQWIPKYFSFSVNFSISVFTIFSIFYLIFNNFVWKSKVFVKILHFPNLDGEWECDGLGHNLIEGKKYPWEGIVVIKQSWDKIIISNRTRTSTSNSISLTGGIKYYPGLGYKVSYHYENCPNASETELKKHEGYCILTFNEECSAAEGCYFNNTKDRPTYGEMILKRR